MNSGAPSIIFLLLLIAFFYFMIIRPQRNRMRAQQQLQSSLRLGDEIVTIAGFIGTIRRFDGDVVTIELSPGVEARLNRRAISGKVTPSEDDIEYEEDLDESDEADDRDDGRDDGNESDESEAAKP
ncbi:MAG TPA: preprotein translocase subunit YajC [Actinomycetes bacterium]|jgi:preprotein translocase subunit YajC|nr:preprotein translocase subunit YajC [Actinomycetes bacterium]